MKVCAFTGTRADYGLLLPVLRRLEEDPDVDLHVLVSGTHLSHHYGNTVDVIREDGYANILEVPLDLADDSPTGVCATAGEALKQFGRVLPQINPDILILLGDRYEAFACAGAASICRIPIAHIHGGEVTEGAVDEVFRHAISKMSCLHFTSTAEYMRRVIQLGEAPARVFNVGALGVENIKNLPLLGREELEGELGFRFGNRMLLCTYHPVTLHEDDVSQAEDFFKALSEVLDADNKVRVIMTGTNADMHGRRIFDLACEFVQRYADRVHMTPSLGQLRYLSAMQYAACVVGNSSSGIIEAPSFGVPTVNIGDRQKGRVRADSVIDCGASAGDISRAVKHALEVGRDSNVALVNPYEQADTSLQIVEALKSWNGDTVKSFYDLPCSGE